MVFYRRRLPHLYEAGQPTFITWRLYGSLPAHRVFPNATISSGKAFAAMDLLLDESATGPLYLRQPALAEMVVDCIYYAETVLRYHTLHAFVVMPNHVHLLSNPQVPLEKLTKILKSYTAKRANEILGRTGQPFWQEESYDHLVRSATERERIKRYIEQNPVRAGLVRKESEYRWSSAGWSAERPAAEQEFRAT